jgi:hypothetical protein
MATKTGICNMALRHLHVTTPLSDVDADNTKESLACLAFFDDALNQVLRDFPWPFATTIAALAGQADDPNDEWDYSYTYPSDCLMLRRILSGYGRNETRNTRVPHRIIKSGATRLILTDMDEAEVEYTAEITDLTNLTSDFVLAFSYLIAGLIAPSVTGGDATKLGERSLQKYMFLIENARNNAINEEQPDLPVDSEFITERG